MSNKIINSGKRNRAILVVFIMILASIGLCATSGIVKAVDDRSDYEWIIRQTDTYLLQRTDVTRYYRDMAWRHNDELFVILYHMTPAELLQAATTCDIWMPNMRALLKGKGDTVVITAKQVDALSEELLFISSRGSPSLHDDILQEMERLHLSDFVGMTMTEAWAHLHDIWGISNPPPATDSEFLQPPTITPTLIPWHSPTPAPTQLPYTVRTPQATLDGNEFASFWATYRDPDDGYGFAYPSDWVLRGQPDIQGKKQTLIICNNDSLDDRVEQTERICVVIEEDPTITPSLPLDQAATKAWCDIGDQFKCGPISLIPETPERPTHTELILTIISENPHFNDFVYVFRNQFGKLISLYSYQYSMQTPEAQGIVYSFVFGDDTPIVAPSFEPSKKISVGSGKS